MGPWNEKQSVGKEKMEVKRRERHFFVENVNRDIMIYD